MTKVSIVVLQQFITDNCFRSDGNFLGACANENWWKKRSINNYYLQILEETSFLTGTFIFATRLWHILENSLVPTKCNNPNCNNQQKWIYGKYNPYCSKACVDPEQKNATFKATCLERYGVSSPMKAQQFKDKMKTNLVEKYGVDSFSKTSEFKDKFKETCNTKFGVDNPAKLDSVKQKMKATSFTRYGAEYALQNKEVLDKRSATNIEKFGGNSPMNCEIVKATHRQSMLEKCGVENNKHLLLSESAKTALDNAALLEEWIGTKSATEIAKNLSVDVTTVINYLKRHGIHDKLHRHSSSFMESVLADFLTEHNIAFEQNNRKIIAPQELDFYIPAANLAIELCGVYWHSESNGKDKTYHYNKWKRCRDKGITLLTYFDDEFNRSLNVIKSKILYELGLSTAIRIGARQVTLGTPSNDDEVKLLNENHIQQHLKSRQFKIGAYYDGKLIGLMCASQRKADLEITRYVTDVNYLCNGLFSKLLSHLIKDLNFKGNVTSFSDNCHGYGKLYQNNGFSVDSEVKPAYYYTYSGRPRENRQSYMKSKIAAKFDVDVSAKTEEQLMKDQGYDRVWDCGKIKWIKKIS